LIVDRDSIIQLSDSSVIVRNQRADGDNDNREFRYVDYSLIRTAIRKLVKALVEYYRDELFPDLCGNCGKCCMGRFIRVTAKERQLIVQFLHLDSTADVHDFLAETATWNERDGVLKRMDGRCVFLRESITGRYLCTIYSVRPYGCISLSPLMEICEKNIGKLIYHLDTIHIQGDTVMFMRKSKASLERVLDSSSIKSAIEDLRLLCASVEDPLSVPSEEQVRKETDRKLRQLRYDYIRQGETPMFLERVKEITDYLSGLNREMPPAPVKGSEGGAWHFPEDFADHIPEDNTDHTQEGFSAIREKGDHQRTGSCDEDAVDHDSRAVKLPMRISLGADSAFLRVHCGESSRELHITYSEHADMLPLVRRFMQVLVQSGDKALLDTLWHPDPFCFMCGECCRIYKVEISPYDIERIAEHLNLSIEDMWRSHTHPSIFSWNEADGILAKKDGARLDVQKSFAPCIFLCDGPFDIHYCSIYEFRPEICRSYSANSDKCRILCQLKKWESLIENIVTLEIEGDVVYLTTRQTHLQGKPPHMLSLLESEDLKESYLLLYDAFLEIERSERMDGS